METKQMNVRLPGETQEQLARICEATGYTVTQAIIRALDTAHLRFVEERYPHPSVRPVYSEFFVEAAADDPAAFPVLFAADEDTWRGHLRPGKCEDLRPTATIYTEVSHNRIYGREVDCEEIVTPIDNDALPSIFRNLPAPTPRRFCQAALCFTPKSRLI